MTQTGSGGRRSFLLRDGEFVAPLELAATAGTRTKGLLGRDGIEGAILLERTRGVHTVGMRFALDVAFCDRDRRVLRVRTMRPGRIVFLVPRARSVIEAEAGTFATWGIVPGVQLSIGVADGSVA